MRARLRPLLVRLTVVIMSLTVAGLLGELLCRLVGWREKWTPPPPARLDPYGINPFFVSARPFLFFHIPNSKYIQAKSSYAVTYSINSLGFRGPEVPLHAPAGRKRLLVIGDSIVEGHGSEYVDSLPSLLDAALRPRGWEAVNGGVQGASPIYYALNLPRYFNLNPDAVLLVLFDNDLRDDRVHEWAYSRIHFLTNPDYLIDGVDPNGEPLKGSHAHSRLLGLIEQVIGRRLVTRTGVPPRELLALIRHNLADHAARSGDPEQKELDKESPFIISRTSFDAEWGLTAAYLDYFARELRKKNVSLQVAYLSLNVHPGTPEARRHALTLGEKASAWAASRGVPFLSLVPTVSALSDAEFTAFTLVGDGHPSAAGHRVIAAKLMDWLPL